MKTTAAIITILAFVLFLGGCVVHSPPEPDFYHQPQVVVVHAEFFHSDAEWMLWEYYDWDYDVVYDLHNRYRYSDDEVALILFLSYYGHCQPIQVVQWRQAGIPWMTITTARLRLEPDIFFIPVASTHKFGPPYGNAYGRYWKNPRTVVLTDSEMVSLVYLKTTCLAYNASPIDVIRLHDQGHDFNYIVRTHRSQGHHIRTAHGRNVKGPPDKVKLRPDDRDNDKDKGKSDKNKTRTDTKPAKDKGKTDKSKTKTKPKENKPKTNNKGGQGKR